MLQYYSLFAVSPIASIATTVSGQSLFAASPIASTATTVSDHSFFLQSPRLHGHLPRMPIINWKAWLRSVSRMCVFLNCLDSVHELLLWLLHVQKQYDRTTSVRVTQCSAASHVSMNEIYVSILMCRQLTHNGKQH
jgi:hypothetical protein